MLNYILPSCLTCLLFLILYVIYFLILKPLINMRFYKDQGIKMTFFPLIGSVKQGMDSLAATDDFYGLWKKQIKQNPNLRIIGGNFLDRPQLFLLDTKLIKEFFNNQEKYVKVPETEKLLEVIFGKGLMTTEGEDWKRQRKIISSAFRFEFIRDMTPEIVQIIDQLLEDLKKKDLSRLDISREFEGIAGEVIGRLFFGKDFHGKKIQGDNPIIFFSKLGERMGAEAKTLQYLIFGVQIFGWSFLAKYKKMGEDAKEFRQMMSSIIEESREKAKLQGLSHASNTLLDVLINQELTSSIKPLSLSEIIDTFIVLVAGGSNTTATAVARALNCLEEHPEIRQKLMEEVNKYFKDPSKVTLDDLNHMDYMNAFIKEILRFYPPLLGLFDRQATQDHELGDMKIKKGTVVNIAALCNNFNPTYYESEDDFDPERWLGDTMTRKSNIKDPFVYIPFSAGSRSCLGQHLGMIEMKIMISLFLKKYDFALEPNYKLKMTQRFTYDVVDQMYVRLTPL